MDADSQKNLETILSSIAKDFNDMVKSLDGKKVISHIKPDSNVGIGHALLFDNGVILEIQVPYSTKINMIDYDGNVCDKIIETFDISRTTGQRPVV